MLQTVLGLDAARIASAFLVAPATMGQRLVRAKAKIRDAGIPFEVPGPEDLPARLDPVLDAVYAAYGAGWEDAAGADPRRRGLAVEAIWLARILVRLVPEEPEARGLLALLLHCEARRAARRSPDGAYIPLAEQDVALWSRPMIDGGRARARRGRRPPGHRPLPARGRDPVGPCPAGVHGRTDWEAVALLYEGLVRLSPSLGAAVGRAAALANARDPVPGSQPSTRSTPRPSSTISPTGPFAPTCSRRLGEPEAAREAYSQAIGLCEDPAVRDFLIRSRDRISTDLD